MKTCLVENCNNPYDKGGYCCKHYHQIRRHGKIQDFTVKSPNEFIVRENYCGIICRNSKGVIVGEALIDLSDIEKCKLYKWCINKNGYVWNNTIGYLHKFIIPNILKIDHKNRNKLDCRKQNLRPVSFSQNAQNQDKSIKNTSGYKGVKKHNCTGKWQASITHNGKFYYLGIYQKKEEAAIAYNEKAKELFGEFAVLNSFLKKRKK